LWMVSDCEELFGIDHRRWWERKAGSKEKEFGAMDTY